MSDITLSSSVRSNLLALQNTADLLGLTQERLATGLKVNSALDDPTAFFTASSLNARASDLNRLQDFVGNAVQTLRAADEGIEALTNLVEAAEATARQALQSSGTGGTVQGSTALTGSTAITALADDDTNNPATTDVISIQAGTVGTTFAVGSQTVSQLITAINADATIGGVVEASLTSDGNFRIETLDGSNLTVANGKLNTGGDVAEALGINTASTAGFQLVGADLGTITGATTLDNLQDTGSTAIADGDDLIIQVGSDAAVTFDIADASAVDIDTFLATINSNTSLGGKIQATFTDATDTISIASLSGEDFTLTAAGTSDVVDALFDGGGGVTSGANGTATTIDLVSNSGTGSTSADRASFATQFDELRTQIDQLAVDSSFNGVNLLNGDSLTVTFNEDSTSSLGISGVTFNSSGLGISASANNFQSDGDIDAAISTLTTATNTLRSQASKFGNNLSVVETRQDFTKNLINVLETGAANLTLADTNEEGANLLALQTRQQLSSTALSLASQADQNVLRLF
ncbi:MAG: flagellin [Pseudomonadota bacterium]